MQLGVARLCLDCHEIHEHERCPVCTSEAFAYITRWVKVENATVQPPATRPTPADMEKVNTYRQILNPPQRSRTSRWLRNGSLLVVAGYVARYGWLLATRQSREVEGNGRSESNPGGSDSAV
jgi:hypothetical protein